MPLLTGRTEDGAEVPVQVDASGRLVALGLKGDPGDRGLQGERGMQGERGLQGERGMQGEKGDPGTERILWCKTVRANIATSPLKGVASVSIPAPGQFRVDFLSSLQTYHYGISVIPISMAGVTYHVHDINDQYVIVALTKASDGTPALCDAVIMIAF